jgi:hypothetical protein
MATINSFGVSPAGNSGFRRAAHTAAGQRKRPIAAATDASVDQGST